MSKLEKIGVILMKKEINEPKIRPIFSNLLIFFKIHCVSVGKLLNSYKN